MPRRGYSEMILSSKPSKAVPPWGTICGSKCRCDRAARRFDRPSSVSTVLAEVPWVCPSRGGRIALLVTEMVRQFGAQRPLEQRLLELLEQAVLAQQVFRLLVAGQKLVKMFGLDRHRESPHQVTHEPILTSTLPAPRPHHGRAQSTRARRQGVQALAGYRSPCPHGARPSRLHHRHCRSRERHLRRVGVAARPQAASAHPRHA